MQNSKSAGGHCLFSKAEPSGEFSRYTGASHTSSVCSCSSRSPTAAWMKALSAFQWNPPFCRLTTQPPLSGGPAFTHTHTLHTCAHKNTKKKVGRVTKQQVSITIKRHRRRKEVQKEDGEKRRMTKCFYGSWCPPLHTSCLSGPPCFHTSTSLSFDKLVFFSPQTKNTFFSRYLHLWGWLDSNTKHQTSISSRHCWMLTVVALQWILLLFLCITMI